jgi:hypothetical protein
MFFIRHRRQENVWRARVAPVIAFLLLSVILAATVIGLGDLLQVEAGSPFHWVFSVGYLAFIVFGICWALVMRATRPEIYAAIGRGADGRVISISGLPPKGPHAEPMSAHV